MRVSLKAATTKISSSRARRRPWTTRSPPCYIQQGRTSANTLRTIWGREGQVNTTTLIGPNSLPNAIVLAFGMAGTVKPSNREAEEEGSCDLATKPGKGKDTSR